jgi:hypothetical protein
MLHRLTEKGREGEKRKRREREGRRKKERWRELG